MAVGRAGHRRRRTGPHAARHSLRVGRDSKSRDRRGAPRILGTEPLLVSTERGPLAGRRIVVGVTGSIAAYKAVLLVRRLMERGGTVDVALTRSAAAFVTPLTFASLTHRPVV